MRGKFIVLEGGEGAGKSSTIAWLKGKLPKGKFIFTREPGGTKNAEEIREIIVAKREDELDTLTLLLLFEAARREHVLKTITPALEAGKHVVCDRFSASTYAYQIVAGEHEDLKKFFLEIDDLVCDDVVPDHTLFLDLDPNIGIARKSESGDRLNVFDEKALVFHESVRTGMTEYLAGVPHTIIDAGKPQEEVRERIKEVILSLTNHG